jgi:hypothetical protein
MSIHKEEIFTTEHTESHREERIEIGESRFVKRREQRTEKSQRLLDFSEN